MNSTVKKILIGLNVILVIATLGAYLAPHIKPETSFLFPLLGLGYPALLFCNLLAIGVWLFIQPRLAVISLVSLVLGVSSCTRIFNLSLPDGTIESSIKVATYNVNFSKPIQFSLLKDKAEKEQAFSSYLKKHNDIGILCVQENGQLSEVFLKKDMDFPYSHKIKGRPLTIYSKYPFGATGIVDFESNIANTCIWADVKVGTAFVRVYTTHLESNRHDGKVPSVIAEDAPEAVSNSALFGIARHYQKFSTERLRQTKLIKAHAESSEFPVIICGDFNEPPESHVYKITKGDMQDTFVEEGLGIGSTFGEKIPALRIDFIFVDKSIEVLDHDISRSEFSDHYLVTSTLEI